VRTPPPPPPPSSYAVSSTRGADSSATTTTPTTAAATAAASAGGSAAIEAQDGVEAVEKIRPLHRNWWPVASLGALHANRPNPLRVLGIPLVAFRSSSSSPTSTSRTSGTTSDVWTVLDDRCSHRFAPLSEGRVVAAAGANATTTAAAAATTESTSPCATAVVQCSYHGWEFDSNGECVRVPQSPGNDVDKARKVRSYPVRLGAGMLWVWTDPDGYSEDDGAPLAESIRLPIDPMLEKFVDRYGPSCCFQRDLPYGMELLGENLIDLSHLPYAHHSLGQLRRELGRDLPTRMLSRSEREGYARWEAEYRNRNSGGKTGGGDDDEVPPVVPTFQAEIVQAAKHDPILMPFAEAAEKAADGEVAKKKEKDKDKLSSSLEDWTTTISYFSPFHVRYRRTRGTSPGSSSTTELFMCPTGEGRSRVFLFNCFGALLEDDIGGADGKKKVPLAERIKLAVLSRLFDPRRVAGHMMSHQIFDGDGIFLRMQGDRMKNAGLSYSDYSTPASCDVMLNAYRRYLDAAAKKTRQLGLASFADAATGSGQYDRDLPRSEMLDRYNTHTKNCPNCSAALRSSRKLKSRVGLLRIASAGTAGASTTALVACALLPGLLGNLIPSVVYRALAGTTAATWVATMLFERAIRRLDKRINSFLFEDYVHAEKD